MYRVTFAGASTEFPSLLPAMEYRKRILTHGVPEWAVNVWERGDSDWLLFDTEQFLAGLRLLLAPTE